MSSNSTDLDADKMQRARKEDLVRLARFIGIDVSDWIDAPDARFRIACAIARWYKKHPQPRRDKRSRNKNSVQNPA